MALSAIFIIFYIAPVIVISALQISFVKKDHKVAILSPSDFLLAKNYAIISQYFNIFQTIWSAILFAFWVLFGFQMLDSMCAQINSAIFAQVVFLELFFIFNYFLNLPFDAYKTLIIDKHFGFTQSGVKLFLLDSAKSFFILFILVFLAGGAIIWIIERFSFWWILGFAFMFLIALLANLIYPTIIAPLFNKFSQLDDENLKNDIQNLMSRVGFSANGIFVMDASKRDGRLNAYFGGLGKSKRVVIFDTLLNKVSRDELLAILGHELGHFKHKDLIKNIAIIALLLFILFFIAGHLPDSIFNVEKNGASILAMIVLLSSMISFYFMPFINYFSRKAEYRADEFGSELVSKKDLSSALIKLINENKAFPYSHKFYIFFYMSHPPLLERLKALE